MDMEASVATGLRAAGEKARMDASCKRLLSEKRILAWIMKSCLEEYRDCTYRRDTPGGRGAGLSG